MDLLIDFNQDFKECNIMNQKFRISESEINAIDFTIINDFLKSIPGSKNIEICIQTRSWEVSEEKDIMIQNLNFKISEVMIPNIIIHRNVPEDETTLCELKDFNLKFQADEMLFYIDNESGEKVNVCVQFNLFD